MGRFSGGGSYDHSIKRMSWGDFRIYWTVDFYYSGSRMRFPRVFYRDTNKAGAKRFAKKWGCNSPEDPRSARP